MGFVVVEGDTVLAKANIIARPEAKAHQTGEQIRCMARSGSFCAPTTTVAPGFVQANLIVLPSKYASDFRRFCKRNPVPCPLLAESKSIGVWDQLQSHVPGLTGEQIAANVDIRSDFPLYLVYDNGTLTKSKQSLQSEWTQDHVAFLIGCSFSFDNALTLAGLPPAHTLFGRNVPMYRTSIPLCPAGAFKKSTYVVSMRPYRRKDIERVRDITRPYLITHGEPLDWGWDALNRLGIADISHPEYGDKPITPDGAEFVKGIGVGGETLEPVFFGCGVTPQEAIQRIGLQGRVFAHAPGHMIVLDIRDSDIIQHT
ncbi:uncharacterized protein A1O9_10182 [Exophiala aquamarina CBS 119918]|uniref:DUF1445 domain-containing protein n=1 Tax=Exophiala aquamarina CBS 119918 TaxID=1182545 RepID=A0A072P1V1_9EURO|nr:uncharacterized protein A1O9_10182 [Exophiala aquamarina CBS 119918]KEF53781.1 hypothetical protein A1O9_10182 [Exophiala aquamarina CBS 119918]